jgi:hypothetical protein
VTKGLAQLQLHSHVYDQHIQLLGFHQSGINITREPKMKIQQPISKQTLMKSNAQLRRDDSDDEVPIPAAMLVGFLDVASSYQTVPPSEPEINFSQIMEALAAIQGGMSTMQ